MRACGFKLTKRPNPQIRLSGNTTNNSIYQRTANVTNEDYLHIELTEGILSRNASQVQKVDDLHDSDHFNVDNTDSDDLITSHLNDMASRRRNDLCWYCYQYPYPWWVALIKPIFQVTLVMLCGYGVSSIFTQYNNMAKSLDVLSINLHEIKMDLEIFARSLRNANEEQKKSDHQIHDIMMIVSKLTLLTNQSAEQRSSMEQENLNLIQMLNSAENIKDVVKREIHEYDADKTSRSDYALESAGGKILSILSSKPYIIETGSIISRGWNFLMRLMCNPNESARPILQPSVNPGQCWAFEGVSGSVIVELLANIYITGLTLEHIPASISPTGEISSAPKTFSFWGIENTVDYDSYFFGEFVYDKDGSPVQYFDLQYNSNELFNIVQLKIHSNWGNPDYTCIYRLRVHGRLKESKLSSYDKTP